MVNNVEQPKEGKKTTSVLEDGKVKDFIQDRDIKPEDFYLIEKLSTFSKPDIIEGLHNLFNLSKERSGADLEGIIKNTKDDAKKAMYEVALKFYQKYDWIVSWNLIRVLENLKK
ncbi:MAG: hypothetical protein AAB966_03215 [Patescibacteria group bacterium]